MALALAVSLGGCGDDGGSNGGDTGTLPPTPAMLEPTSGAVLDTDTPCFTVRNALGFDGGVAE